MIQKRHFKLISQKPLYIIMLIYKNLNLPFEAPLASRLILIARSCRF